MNTPKRILSLFMAIFIVVAAVVAHFLGIPDRLILLVAGFMLSGVLLEAFWVKNSVGRAMILMTVSTLGGLVLFRYLFNVPLGLLIFAGVFLFVTLLVTAVLRKRSTAKSKERIAQWAAANGWQLLEFEQRLDTGPFGGIHWRAQMYFEFVVMDQQGRRHTGWAHFDHSLIGSGRYEVKWIENPEKQSK